MRSVHVVSVAICLAAAGCSANVGEAATEEAVAIGQAQEALSTYYMNLDVLAKGLKDGLDAGKGPKGYAWVIYQDGALVRSGASGYARISPAVPFTPDVPVSMMST